jgi:hypothetical protein
MSFNNNHINSSITLQNYEEYFILYMDKELSPEQLVMVEQFLEAHPELQSELDILISTKLPTEDFTIDKELFFSDAMKTSVIGEDLLLYIDNELDAAGCQKLEGELSTNKDLQLQHDLLQRTRLDASEKIVYPNKKELYRHTETRVVSIKMWMRIAAAVVVILFMGILYWANQGTSTTDVTPGTVANVQTPATPPAGTTPKPGNTEPAAEEQQVAAANPNPVKEAHKETKGTMPQPTGPSNEVAQHKVPQEADLPAIQRFNSTISTPATAQTAYAGVPENISVNPVTSDPSKRTTITEAAAPQGPQAGDVANKTTLKGLLRKATRVLERRTGVDPTNDKEEVLIGVMAIKLN